ncbi:MAG: 3-hydroxyacyl-CoA dehydrogenase/enoyl-CoA hydratase family protein [Myxococcales bacterium]|nr:3-hydroxyacyl-CoA dehydrogenase/enoyl-CoA hydratase family protein [Myxococcales bacterium]
MIVGVIGSGAIGPDLAYGFLSSLSREPGSKVYLVDIKQEALDAGVARIHGYLKKGVARGKIAPKDAAAVKEALVGTRDLKALADCDYVLEAASEDLGIKKKILAELETIVRPDCLVGFATSGLPRRHIAAEAKHPERCFVNHPFYPAWRSLPIEIVKSGHAELDAKMVATIEKLGRVPIITADVECFAADDVFCNYIAEAARIAEEGVATPAQVDAIVNDAIGGGGPFNVMDLTKGNLLVHKCQVLMQNAEGTGTAWFAPPAILKKQGDAPWHDRSAPADATYTPALATAVMDRILAVLLARTYALVENDVCAPTDTNWLMRMALGFRKGTLELGEDLGADRVRELCVRYAEKNPGFPVPKLVAERRLPAFRKNILVEKDGDIAVVKVFRPEVKNALSKQTLVEIGAAVAELDADRSVIGIVLSSYDGALAGADIQELAVLPDPEACRKTCLDSHPIFERIANAKKPVVAAVDGPVLGGGAELSMACHARVVGKHLLLGQPEVNLGIIPGYGGTQRLPRLIGFERAFDMLRTARSIGAKEACEWGWAHGAPAADPLAAAKALIKDHVAGKVKLAPVSPAPMAVPEKLPASAIGHRSLAVDAILVDVVRRGLAKPLAEGLVVEADGFSRCKATVDMDIGMKNFVQNGPRVPAAFLHE